MEVQQDRRAGRPVAAVADVQRAARPVAVGKAAHPDHVEPARSRAYDELGDGRRAQSIAIGWLRPKLAALA